MEHGDLGTWEVQHIVVVLEGVLARPLWSGVGKWRIRQTKPELLPPSEWAWARTSLKSLVRYSHDETLVDVVTFVNQKVCDEAAEWMLRIDVPFSSCEFIPYEVFVESLFWRPYVARVVDSDSERLMHYGARGYEVQWGHEF